MIGEDRPKPTLTFHPETGEYTTPLGTDPVVLTIVLSLAIVGGVDVTAIEPVARSVDPDGLESLATGLAAGTIDLDGRISFEHAGHRIAIDGDGVLHIEPLDD